VCVCVCVLRRMYINAGVMMSVEDTLMCSFQVCYVYDFVSMCVCVCVGIASHDTLMCSFQVYRCECFRVYVCVCVCVLHLMYTFDVCVYIAP